MSARKRRTAKLPNIEIRDKRLRGGRLVLSARTSDRREWRRREMALRTLLDRGEMEIIERLRDRRDPLHIADVVRALADGDAAVQALRRGGVYRPATDDLTLGSEVERLMQTVRATRSAGTVKEYGIITGQLLEAFGPDITLREVAPKLQDWLHAPKRGRWKNSVPRPWGRARQELARAVIGRIFNSAIKAEVLRADQTGQKPRVTINPRHHIEIATERTKRVEFLQPHEWAALSATIEGRAVHAALALMTLAGLRIAEVAHLRTGIDVVGLGTDEPMVRVQPREGQFPWRPKTDRSVRDVPVGDELHRILLRHVELGFAGDRYFIRAPGMDQPMSTQGLRQWTRAAFEAAGIRYGRKKDALTAHSLRHTFISWLVQADVQLLKIELLAGTSVEMIIRVYSHLMNKDLRAAVKTIDDALSSE